MSAQYVFVAKVRAVGHYPGAQSQLGRFRFVVPLEPGACHRIADAWHLQQGVFDLAQLDAKATDLHLPVSPAQRTQRTGGVLLGQIPRTITALPRPCGLGIGHKAFGRQSWCSEIALGNARASDDDFAHCLRGRCTQFSVAQGQTQVGQGRAQWHHSGVLQIFVSHGVEGHMYSGLGDAVHVD